MAILASRSNEQSSDSGSRDVDEATFQTVLYAVELAQLAGLEISPRKTYCIEQKESTFYISPADTRQPKVPITERSAEFYYSSGGYDDRKSRRALEDEKSIDRAFSAWEAAKEEGF